MKFLLVELQGPGGEQRTLRVEPRIASNNQVSIQQMCCSGLGLALVGSVDAAEEVASRQLVRLLPAWQARTLDVWAVTRSATPNPRKCGRRLRALQAYLLEQPGIAP